MPDDKKTQKQRFVEAARQVGVDDDEQRFEDKLKQIASSPPHKRDTEPFACPDCGAQFVITDRNGMQGVGTDIAVWKSTCKDRSAVSAGVPMRCPLIAQELANRARAT